MEADAPPADVPAGQPAGRRPVTARLIQPPRVATPLRRDRDFQLPWAGQAVSVVGSRTSQIAYPLLPLGSLAAGVLVQAFGPAKAGFIAGAGMLVMAALTTAAPSVRRGPELAN